MLCWLGKHWSHVCLITCLCVYTVCVYAKLVLDYSVNVAHENTVVLTNEKSFGMNEKLNSKSLNELVNEGPHGESSLHTYIIYAYFSCLAIFTPEIATASVDN